MEIRVWEDFMGIKWAKCGKCGHKLFRVTDGFGGGIEIKCHSCKTLNVSVADAKKESATKTDTTAS